MIQAPASPPTIMRNAMAAADSGGRGGMIHQGRRETNRPRDERASAVRAMPLEVAVGAQGAERAFETADPCIDRARRQVRVAALAVGPEFEHDHLLRAAPVEPQR
jgi:hypothetical protein